MTKQLERKKTLNQKIVFVFTRYWQYYVLLLIPILYIIIFNYIPMYGVQIAFKNYRAGDGIWGSEWIGFANFERFFQSGGASRIIMNTIRLSLYSLIAGFPFPIILALSLSYMRRHFLKKTIQMISYAPHFISTVVMVGILMQFLSRNGFVNNMRGLFGLEPFLFMGEVSLFDDLYVWSGIWQNVGFSSIIYIGVITSVDYQLHEAAIVDGASVLRRIWHIDLPAIIPTAVTMFIMNVGNILNVGFEKVFLMQNTMNTTVSEIISTYTYKMGFQSTIPDYSYTTAIGLFQSLIGFILLVVVNRFARKVSNNSIW